MEVKAKKSEPIGAPKRLQKSSKANMQGAKPPAGPPPPPKHATRASLEHAPSCPPKKARPLPKHAAGAPLEHEPPLKKAMPRRARMKPEQEPSTSSSRPLSPTILAATPATPPDAPEPPPPEKVKYRGHRGGAYSTWYTAVNRAIQQDRIEEFYSANRKPTRENAKQWKELRWRLVEQ